MNIEDIKKGLECCSNTNILHCVDCPYDNKDCIDCNSDKMHQDALNLINELENQIAALQREVESKQWLNKNILKKWLV